MNITRRTLIKGAGAAAVLGPATLLTSGCASKKQLVTWSITGLQILHDISPTLEAMGATDIVALIAKATPYAEKLKQALENNDTPSAGDLLDKLISADGWLAKIADAVGLLKDEHRRLIIMGSLAIAQTAYRLIYAQVQAEAPAAMTAAMTAKPERAAALKRATVPDKLRQAFEATRF